MHDEALAARMAPPAPTNPKAEPECPLHPYIARGCPACEAHLDQLALESAPGRPLEADRHSRRAERSQHYRQTGDADA